MTFVEFIAPEENSVINIDLLNPKTAFILTGVLLSWLCSPYIAIFSIINGL